LTLLALCLSLASPLQAELLHLRDYEDVGGDFTLTDQYGKPWTLSKQGKVVMIFFGYLNCPDICPMTIMEMVDVKNMLGAAADQVQFVLVSLDPERDSAENMKDYLVNFDPDFVGLIGPDHEIAKIAKMYNVLYKKRILRSAMGYSVDHSGAVYMVSKEGKLRFIFPSKSPKNRFLQGIQMMLDGKGDGPLPKGKTWFQKMFNM